MFEETTKLSYRKLLDDAIVINEECPGVQYICIERRGERPTDYYVVDKAVAAISDDARQYGKQFPDRPDLLFYVIDDPTGGKAVIEYEIRKCCAANRLPLPNDETLSDFNFEGWDTLRKGFVYRRRWAIINVWKELRGSVSIGVNSSFSQRQIAEIRLQNSDLGKSKKVNVFEKVENWTVAPGEGSAAYMATTPFAERSGTAATTMLGARQAGTTLLGANNAFVIEKDIAFVSTNRVL